jgi:CheY-like chemotaxis protein/two-component sensor histidine kinase
MKPMPVDLNTIIVRFGKLLRRLIREDIDIRLDLCEHDTTIMAESIQLEQVLMNLATNARDAMPDGGVLAITTAVIDGNGPTAAAPGTGIAGPVVRLTISDTGIGMDERTRERVFEPFYTTKEMGKGTGLGLALVYSIISQHNGSIDAESTPGAGTSFHISFPLVKPGLPLDAKAPETKISGGTETILVAEDDQILLDLTRSVLEEFGYTVLAARDGEDAVRMFRENRDRVRLLLFDVIMPKKNGRATFEEIRSIVPGMKVLFVSGYSADIISKEGILDAGADMITKPLSPVELLRKVREVLDR